MLAVIMFNIVLLIALICAYFYTAYFEAGNFNCEAGKYKALEIIHSLLHILCIILSYIII